MKKIKENLHVIILGVAALAVFLTMEYSDNLVNSEYGYRFVDSIFSGTFIEFFNKFDWSYGASIYTIYAVWSIPIWVINNIFRINIGLQSVGVLLWYKFLLVLFCFWSVYLVGKIAEIIYKERKTETKLQYVCSSLLFFVILYIARRNN